MNELAINKTTRATSVSPLGTVETKVRLDNGLRRYAAGRRLANGRHVRVALGYHKARDHWRGVDPTHPPSDLSTWWRCCCRMLEISYMQSYRDLDVPSVCQASPRGVALMYRENSANGWIQRWKIGY